ncbi:hypothetical protein BDR26DRAFT_858436 [Obelidium mucronatum]|nr:hypothetical protein BDR26DRAFT_858436 [Obelidium mucronatum]
MKLHLTPILFAATAMAHFVIDVPASRFFDEEVQPVAPCGGQPLGARTDFPIVGGSIKGMLLHPTGTGRFSIVISKTDPLASQFGQVLIGPGANVRLTEGNFDTGAIDLSSIPGVVDGAQATMQVQISTVDGVLYTCMDVTLRGSSGPAPTTVPPPPPPPPPPQTTAVVVPPPPATTQNNGGDNGNGGNGGNSNNNGGSNPQPTTDAVIATDASGNQVIATTAAGQSSAAATVVASKTTIQSVSVSSKPSGSTTSTASGSGLAASLFLLLASYALF